MIILQIYRDKRFALPIFQRLVWTAFLLFTVMLSACSLPKIDDGPWPSSFAINPDSSGQSTLGQVLSPLAAQYPGLSGIYPLPDPLDAFVARMVLAEAADQTLDVQYYIWRADVTGKLLMDALYQAAERGVRVRLLLDDNGIIGLDEQLLLLNRHEHIEVRLFNPFVVRSPKWLGFVTDFSRLNRRMHNKSFTVDNQATLVGGRNIGDEYFAATPMLSFVDLDVLAVGEVVNEVSQDFDLYWASPAAFPIDRLVKDSQAPQLNYEKGGTEQAAPYFRWVKENRLLSDLLAQQLEFEWTVVTMLSDDPKKISAPHKPSARLAHYLEPIIGEAQDDVWLISPYFVPTRQGVEELSRLVERGVRVRVLTNSLASTDVLAVHAGYARYRQSLLQAGVELFEIKRYSPVPFSAVKDGVSEPVAVKKSFGILGSSAASLHAKTFAIDDRRVFVGSFNFDPRSIELNTELGFIIDSPQLAEQMAQVFTVLSEQAAYQVKLDAEGELYWRELKNGVYQNHEREPDSGFLHHLGVFLFSLLPIEGLL